MFQRKPLSVAVNRALSTVAMAATAVSTTAPVFGQQAQEVTLEEVVVTGSRIASDPNLITSSPVTMVKSEELGFRGITRVEDLIQRPAVDGAGADRQRIQRCHRVGDD